MVIAKGVSKCAGCCSAQLCLGGRGGFGPPPGAGARWEVMTPQMRTRESSAGFGRFEEQVRYSHHVLEKTQVLLVGCTSNQFTGATRWMGRLGVGNDRTSYWVASMTQVHRQPREYFVVFCGLPVMTLTCWCISFHD